MADRLIYVNGVNLAGASVLTPLKLSDNADGSWSLAANATAAGRNVQVGADLVLTWANSAAANNPQTTTDIATPTTLNSSGEVLVTVRNPSTVTALTVILNNKHLALGGADRYSELTRLSVPANSVRGYIVKGWLYGDGGQIVASNDTVLGGADGFSAQVRVRQL